MCSDKTKEWKGTKANNDNYLIYHSEFDLYAFFLFDVLWHMPFCNIRLYFASVVKETAIESYMSYAKSVGINTCRTFHNASNEIKFKKNVLLLLTV
jgi:hypothetical protein